MATLPYRLQRNLSFQELQSSETFVDVTIACGDQILRAHRLVLASCSTFFHKLLVDYPCQHPVIIMPDDICFADLKYIVEFAYSGEVDVPEVALPGFLSTADRLRINGLVRQSSKEDCRPSTPPPPTTTTKSSKCHNKPSGGWGEPGEETLSAAVKQEPLSDEEAEDPLELPSQPPYLETDDDVLTNFEAPVQLMGAPPMRATTSTGYRSPQMRHARPSSYPHDSPPTGNKLVLIGRQIPRISKKWTTEEMTAALRAIRSKRMSVIQAAAHYNIPRSTLFQKRACLSQKKKTFPGPVPWNESLLTQQLSSQPRPDRSSWCSSTSATTTTTTTTRSYSPEEPPPPTTRHVWNTSGSLHAAGKRFRPRDSPS